MSGEAIYLRLNTHGDVGHSLQQEKKKKRINNGEKEDMYIGILASDFMSIQLCFSYSNCLILYDCVI